MDWWVELGGVGELGEWIGGWNWWVGVDER